MIYGRVTGLAGFVLPGATVELRQYKVPYIEGILEDKVAYKIETDQSGEFAFHQISPGLYCLRVKLAGFEDAVIREVYAHERKPFVADLGLRLGAQGPPGGVKLDGIVTTKEGKPLKSASVYSLPAFNPAIVYRTRTDQTGRFEVELESSNSVLIVNNPGYKSHAEAVTFDQGREGSISITLERQP